MVDKSLFCLYTVNILTVKCKGFTCVSFSPVVSLSFWQSRTVKYAKLVFTTSQNFVKSAVKVQEKKRTQVKLYYHYRYLQCMMG